MYQLQQTEKIRDFEVLNWRYLIYTIAIHLNHSVRLLIFRTVVFLSKKSSVITRNIALSTRG